MQMWPEWLVAPIPCFAPLLCVQGPRREGLEGQVRYLGDWQVRMGAAGWLRRVQQAYLLPGHVAARLEGSLQRFDLPEVSSPH